MMSDATAAIPTEEPRRGRSRKSGGPGPRKTAGGEALGVALVGSCYWPVGGGMEMYLRQLASSIADRGHDVHVATRFSSTRPADTRTLHTATEPARTYEDGIVRVHVLAPAAGRGLFLRPVHRVHYRAPGLAAWLMRTALSASLERALDGAEVVHYSGAGREILGFVALREARRLGVPFVVTPHTHEGHWGDGRLDLELYRNADRVVALTVDERERLAAGGVAEDRIAVVGHGVSVVGGGDGGRFRERHGLGDAPVVLFLGRKTPDKGFDLLLEAAPAVWDQVPDARLVLAGADGSPRTLPAAVRDGRVVELGWLSEQEREDAFAACDVFCLPSEAEAFGLVVLEAWHYGRPVVTSDIPTLRERVSAGGGIAAPRRPADIAAALTGLLRDAGTRERLGEQGRAIARSATWEAAAGAMIDLYRAAGAGR